MNIRRHDVIAIVVFVVIGLWLAVTSPPGYWQFDQQNAAVLMLCMGWTWLCARVGGRD
jgi:hypothetical protein